MINEHDEYVLGQDVTSVAESKSRVASAVLSVRLPVEELAAIEAVARRTGKNLSQVVREAVRNCVHTIENDRLASRPTVTVSITRTRTSSTYGPQRMFTLGAATDPEETYFHIGERQVVTTG